MGAKSVLLCLYLHTWRHSRLERELLFHRERFLCCCEPALPPKRPESGFLFPTHSINPLTYFSYTFNLAAQLKLTSATTTYLPVPYFLLKILKIFHKLEICLKREKSQISVSHCPKYISFPRLLMSSQSAHKNRDYANPHYFYSFLTLGVKSLMKTNLVTETPQRRQNVESFEWNKKTGGKNILKVLLPRQQLVPQQSSEEEQAPLTIERGTEDPTTFFKVKWQHTKEKIFNPWSQDGKRKIDFVLVFEVIKIPILISQRSLFLAENSLLKGSLLNSSWSPSSSPRRIRRTPPSVSSQKSLRELTLGLPQPLKRSSKWRKVFLNALLWRAEVHLHQH